MFKRYLLASTAMFAPPGEGDGGPNEGEELHVEETIPGDEGEGEGLGEDSGVEEGQDEDPDAEGSEGQVDPEPRRPNRAQSRIQALTQTAREAKERADKLERDVQEL